MRPDAPIIYIAGFPLSCTPHGLKSKIHFEGSCDACRSGYARRKHSGGMKNDLMSRADIPIFTSDHLYVTAFLICSGHRLIGVSRHGARALFQFERTAALCNDVARFMAGAAVPARQFSFELLKLKRTLHGGK